MIEIENSILAGLLHNEEYMRRVAPFLDESYFFDFSEKTIYNSIISYINSYNGVPTKEALHISMGDKDFLSEDQFNSIGGLINSLSYDKGTDIQWLLDETEKFCKQRALHIAVHESILVLNDKSSSMTPEALPELLQTALGVSFDQNIGHDFLEVFEDRYQFYHTKEDKIPFDIDIFNKITKGGLSRKSLSVILAGTGVGKTLFMTHNASANMLAGLNVLYITMEMAEERIAERIDANLMDVTMDTLRDMPRDVYLKKIKKVKEMTTGKLIIKEYPTAGAGSGHFRHLINELKLKKNFKPDVVYIDYINICMSSRVKNTTANSYTIVKAIAEELRGLAVECNVPIMTATQTTRSGYSNSDIGLEDTSESFGLPATADFMFGVVSTEELEESNQIMIKQLKNRWGDANYMKRFVVGIDRAKMKLYDVEESQQNSLMDDSPAPKKAKSSKPDFSNFT
jgi:replicative DNA helicase